MVPGKLDSASPTELYADYGMEGLHIELPQTSWERLVVFRPWWR
jgi:hypothetical protein